MALTGSPVRVTVAIVVRAARCAAAGVTTGVVDRLPIALVWATEVPTTRPSASVFTTKSPPKTSRPLYVRTYGAYWKPPPPDRTGLAVYASPVLVWSAAARRATRSCAALAARARDWAGEALGVAAGTAPAPGLLSPSAVKVTSPVRTVASRGRTERVRKTMSGSVHWGNRAGCAAGDRRVAGSYAAASAAVNG